MRSLLIKYKLEIAGVLVGAIAGYAYWHFIGCASGSCAITSRPLNSSLYGGLMGGLLFSIFRGNNKLENKTDNKATKNDEFS